MSNNDNIDNTVTPEHNVDSMNTSNHEHTDEYMEDAYSNAEIRKKIFATSGETLMYIFFVIFAFFLLSIGIGLYRGFFGGRASYIDPNIFQSLATLFS